MKGKALMTLLVLLLAGGTLRAQISDDVIGVHDLGPGSKSPTRGMRSDFCSYCHAPHSGIDTGSAPLWNQTLTNQTYKPYTSTTYNQTSNPKPLLGSDSNLCLSCHDGTVAPGTTAVGGPTTMSGSMYTTDVFGTNLSSSHPFSLVLPLNDAPDLVSTLTSGQTADTTGAVKLINGNIECTSCHNPHVQAKDLVAQNFLVKDSSKGQMCLACHDPNRVVQGQTNPLAGWFQSIHATATDAVTNLPYPTLDQNACENCHTNHNAPGGPWLVRGAGDQVCLNCHSGSSTNSSLLASARMMGPRSNLPPAVLTPKSVTMRLDVASEYAKIGHPVATINKTFVQPKMQVRGQMPTPNPNTPDLSGCTDCHDPHAVQSMSGSSATATGMSPALKMVDGVNEKDGSVMRPAQAEYQICIRCHGANTTTSTRPTMPNAKYGYTAVRTASVNDPTNVIPQFNATAVSSHPVFLPRRSPLPQPSLLLNMLNLNGTTQGRPVGAQIQCTDCHNSDDNRQSGGTGPGGPHGSKWSHILERRYEFSTAPTPGAPITNLFPTPDLSANGPYALCAKCHNLSNVMQNASFPQHSTHINTGFSCSTCHTAHGTGINSANATGERLINFDLNVVAPNAGQPISYNRSTNTCTLTCHNTAHNADGTVKSGLAGSSSLRPK